MRRFGLRSCRRDRTPPTSRRREAGRSNNISIHPRRLEGECLTQPSEDRRDRTDGATQPPRRYRLLNGLRLHGRHVGWGGIPPCVVFYDGTSYWLADGFHRVKAAEQAGFEESPASCIRAPARGAVVQFRRQQTNGLRRTKTTNRGRCGRAYTSQSTGLSDRQIGSHVGVDPRR